MQAAGHPRWQLFWAAVGTSLPQPFGAVLAYVLVEQISGLLPISFAFAAGAMLALVASRSGPTDGGPAVAVPAPAPRSAPPRCWCSASRSASERVTVL